MPLVMARQDLDPRVVQVPRRHQPCQIEFFVVNLLVRIHLIIEMI